VKQIIYLHLVPRWRMSEAKLLLHIRLHSWHWNDFTFFMFTAFTNIDVAWQETRKTYKLYQQFTSYLSPRVWV
jgi:hypothetical protein